MQGVDDVKFKQHWIKEGLKDLEEMLGSPHTGNLLEKSSAASKYYH